MIKFGRSTQVWDSKKKVNHLNEMIISANNIPKKEKHRKTEVRRKDKEEILKEEEEEEEEKEMAPLLENVLWEIAEKDEEELMQEDIPTPSMNPQKLKNSTTKIEKVDKNRKFSGIYEDGDDDLFKS
jgi:hypothetical protein